MKHRYAIIGNSVAAVAAVEAIRSIDKDGSLVIAAQETHHAYSRPLITHYLCGEVDDVRMLYRPDSFYETHSVETRLGCTVTGIDFTARKLACDCGGRSDTIEFENLLIATGGKPIFPPIKGNDRQGVFTMNTWDDARAVRDYLPKVKRAVVLGGGLTGLKTAEALAETGREVVIVELAERVLSMALDAQTSELVVEKFKGHGASVMTQNTIEEITGEGASGAVSGVVLKDGTKIDCQMVVVAIGVSPRTELVKDSPVEIRRGIVVDRNMLTTVPGVYAAGDVAEAFDFLLGAERVLPILPTAYGGGRIAGLNMAGRSEEFNWSTSANSVTFFGYPVVFAGFSTAGEGDGEEVMASLHGDVYRKFVLRGGRLIGMIITGSIDRAGIFLGLMRDGFNFDGETSQLFLGVPNMIDLPREVREAKLYGGRNAA